MSRGRTTARGYGATHQRLRARWAPRVERGEVNCWRCGERIQPGDEWHLGHLDDRSGYGGPEHSRACNLSAAGKASAARRAQRTRPPQRHPGAI